MGGRGLGGRGLSGLVILLVALAAGPLISRYLPPGPASLLDPASVAVAAAAAVILYSLFVWPVLATSRVPRAVLVDALLLLSIAMPFVVGLGWSLGAAAEAIQSAVAVVAGAVAVTGVWLTGPGRSGRHDRAFAAFWVFVTAVLPIAAYVLLDFAGTSFPLGFKVSPVLAVRRILLEMPAASPAPFLLTGLAFLAVAAAVGMLRRVAVTGVVLLLLAGSASAAEVTPVLGERYVPGRPVPLRVTGVRGPVSVRVPGHSMEYADEGVVVMPAGIEGLRSVRIDDESVTVDLRPAPPGRWLTALGPVPPALRAAAEEAGFVIGAAAPGAEHLGWRMFLVADGVVDATGLLPAGDRGFLLAAGVAVILGPADLPGESPLRRPWEEEGRVLSAEGLERIFPSAGGTDTGRARGMAFLLLAFGLSSLAVIRFRARASAPFASIVLMVVLSLAATGATALLLQPLPEFQVTRVVARGAGRQIFVLRLHARRETWASVRLTGRPIALGPGREIVHGEHKDQLLLGAHETRLVVGVGPSEGQSTGPFDFFLTPDGLAKPGETALPAGEFLERHFRGPDGRTTSDGWLVRKLLRLDGSLTKRYGVRIPEPGVLEVRRVPD